MLTSEQRIRALEDKIVEIENYRNPLNITGRVDNSIDKLEQIEVLVSNLILKVDSFMSEDKFLELFSDEELSKMYISSKLMLPEIQAFAKSVSGKHVAISGGIPISNDEVITLDYLRLRNKLAKYYRFNIIKNAKSN